MLRTLGAETVIDYRTQRFEDEIRDADAVIDLVGGETQKRSFQVLRRGGRLISAVSPPDQQAAQSHGVKAAFFLVEVTSQALETIARAKGFLMVSASPLTRSSHHAGEDFARLKAARAERAA